MRVLDLPRIPLIEDLTSEAIPAGVQIMVEFDPATPWYNASLMMAATWIRTGGSVAYNAFAQSPDDVRAQLKQLGLDARSLETESKLIIVDWFTVSLGRKPDRRLAPPSLKLHDITIWFATNPLPEMSGQQLIIADNQSVLARFNDEKLWIEFHLTHAIPAQRSAKVTAIRGFLRDIHSAWVYRQLESAVDGIVDIKVEDNGVETADMLRIRSLRNVRFDRNWHRLRSGSNGEVALEK